MTTTFNKCQVNRLERSTNYCVRVRMSVNTNENSRFSQWHCAFTSPEEISKVPFLLVAVCVLLVLSAVVMAALVYSGYLCKPKTQLPKVLASFTLHHSSCRLQQCLVAERCPVVPVCIVYKQECKLKRRSRTLLDSSESENSDSGGEDGYEAQATRPAVYRCSSARLGEPKQAYEPDDPEQKQCLLVCDEFLVEQPQDQPDQEEKEPVIEGRYSEQQESSQDIPLFSVLLERHGDGDDDEILESPPMELALDQEDSKLLPEEHQGSPLMGSIESVNCVTGHLNIEMKDIEEQRYYSDSEEEDDTGLSGYMRR
ncbi:uncharacterized protein LOC121320783 [Polyodon spathula]|uniref:uncharacterized protein LOC121320783 n=1 Tax=Polyodon spathula TaxID=7913 RepID=UPI001B7EC4F8|nr:uncharacterized protein LOC121320783 [Polyodon spathula]